MKHKAYQTGMTLIEIMIALLIGLFLLGGMIQILTESQQTYRMQENLARLQETGRFAMDFLAHDSRMAGYTACLASPVPTPITGTNDNGLNASDTITIQLSTESGEQPPLLPTLFKRVQAGNQLYFKNDAAAAQELIEGIENMQILYGVDTDTPHNGANYYVPASPALDWPNVVSIRITLTARTLDGNLTTTGDGRIRRNFTSTIAVRNRLS